MVKRFYFTVTDERPQEYDFKAPECLLVDDTWSLNCADDFSGVVQPADINRFALTIKNSTWVRLTSPTWSSSTSRMVYWVGQWGRSWGCWFIQ